MQGIYYYADLCSGRIWGLERVGDSWKNTLLLDRAVPGLGIGEDESGELWLTDYNHGAIDKLVDFPPVTPVQGSRNTNVESSVWTRHASSARMFARFG